MTDPDTLVPAVIDALVELVRDHSTDFEVYDGAPESDPDELGRDVAVIGTNYGEMLAVVGATTGPGGLMAHPAELFTVGFVITSIRDPGQTKEARDRVAEALSILSTALKANLRLKTTTRPDGVCDRAQLAPAWSWSTQRVIYGDNPGVEVTYRGGIEVKGLL